MGVRNPSVAIILVNWNGSKLTVDCIESLRLLEYDNFETIVVDNASESEDLATLRTRQDITLIENQRNLGFTGGNNVGIDYALEKDFQYILLLNNDTTVSPDFLRLMLEPFADENVGAVQPKIYLMEDKARIWSAGGELNPWIGFPRTIGSRRLDSEEFSQAKDLDWITGCCFLIPTDLVRTIGPLDDIYFAIFEDLDWSLRIRKEGKVLRYQPKAHVYHVGSASTTAKKKGKEGRVSPTRHYLNVRNHLFMIRKNIAFPHIIGAAAVQVIKLTIYLTYFALRGRWTKFKKTLKGVRHGLGEIKSRPSFD